MSLDLNKLSNKLDEALSNETTETLNKFLNDKRMTNNKEHLTDWIFEQLEYKGDLRETPSIRNIQLNIDTSDYMELKVQAKEMEKERIIKAFDDGDYNYHYSRKTGNDFENGEEYYNEVYGGGEQ